MLFTVKTLVAVVSAVLTYVVVGGIELLPMAAAWSG